MEIKASAKYLRSSPRKLWLLTKGLAGLTPQKALEKLNFYRQPDQIFLVKLFKQALANAKNNFKIDEGNLLVKKIEVGEGPSFKRMDKSHGARFDRGLIHKRTAHIFLTLEEKPKKEIKKNVGAQLIAPAKKEKSSFAKATEGHSGTKS